MNADLNQSLIILLGPIMFERLNRDAKGQDQRCRIQFAQLLHQTNRDVLDYQLMGLRLDKCQIVNLLQFQPKD